MAAIGVDGARRPDGSRFLEQRDRRPGAGARRARRAAGSAFARARRAHRPPHRSSASAGSSSRCSVAATTSPSRACATSSSSSSSRPGSDARTGSSPTSRSTRRPRPADLAGPPHLDEDYLVLSTIHSAKGGEWDVVHVIHAADGMIPSDMATGDADEIEEERRLLYVALTRARDALHVYFPLRYHRSNRGLEDRHWYAQLTRFLPEEVRSRFAHAHHVRRCGGERRTGGDRRSRPGRRHRRAPRRPLVRLSPR